MPEPSLYLRIETLVHQLLKKRDLFSRFAETTCDIVDGLRLDAQGSCWTGEDFGTYSKLVAHFGRRHAKDNPEVSDGDVSAPALGAIGTRLEDTSRLLSTLNVILMAKSNQGRQQRGGGSHIASGTYAGLHNTYELTEIDGRSQSDKAVEGSGDDDDDTDGASTSSSRHHHARPSGHPIDDEDFEGSGDVIEGSGSDTNPKNNNNGKFFNI